MELVVVSEIQELFFESRRHVKSGDLHAAKSCLDRMKDQISDDILDTQRWHIVENVEKMTKGNKGAFILDYGCGDGQSITYLNLLGYNNVYGVDLKPQDKCNEIMKLLGCETQRFFQYDGGVLPFRDGMFDLVYSEQVLEHVQDIDGYYREASRVLKPGSSSFFSFPHRFIPYDPHGRTWFLHMLPKPLALSCYRILGRDADRLDRIMNFRSVSYHRRIAGQYFCDIRNVASDRLKRFSKNDLQRYRGNRTLRKFADKMINNRLLGGVATTLFATLSIADLTMRKK